MYFITSLCILLQEQSKSEWNSYKSDEGLEDELRSNRNAG